MVLDFNEVQSYYMQDDKLILHNKTHKFFKIRVDICSDFDYTILNPNWVCVFAHCGKALVYPNQNLPM